MKVIAVTVVLLFKVVVTVKSGTCDDCKATYSTAVTSDACSALKDYLKCLDITEKSSAGCPLAPADAEAIENIKEGTVCSVPGDPLSAVCICQKKFWSAKGDCAALGGLKACIGTDGSKGCDGSSTGAQTFDHAEKRLGCPLNTPKPGALNTPKPGALNTPKPGALNTPKPDENSTLKVTTQSSKGVRVCEGSGFLVSLLLSSLLMMLM